MSEPVVVVDPEQVADVLEAAADYIDVHGWCQQFVDFPLFTAGLRTTAKKVRAGDLSVG